MVSQRYWTIPFSVALVATIAAGTAYLNVNTNNFNAGTPASTSKIEQNIAGPAVDLQDGVVPVRVAASRGLNSSLAPAEAPSDDLTGKQESKATFEVPAPKPVRRRSVETPDRQIVPRPRATEGSKTADLRPYQAGNAVLSHLDRKIRRWMTKQRVPGLSASIVKGAKIVWSNGYGVANIAKKIPYTPDQSLSPIASITKTFTATAIMQLRDRGLLDLDQDINELLKFSVRNPRYPRAAITVRDLLTHRSSIIDSDVLDSIYAIGDPTTSLEKIVIQYFSKKGAWWSWDNFGDEAPGEEASYSNIGFALLGYLVEVVSKQPLEQYLRQNIYRTVKMNETSFYIAKLERGKQVHGYTYTNRFKDELHPDIGHGNLLPNGVVPKIGYNEHALYSYPTLADGMIRTSVNQLANFLVAMINGGQFDGARLLKKGTVNEMLTGRSQGLAWYRIGSYWGHTGSDPGYTTIIAFKPDSKVGFIIFANAEVKLANLKYVTDLLSDKIEDL